MFCFFLNFCETISGRKSHEAVISARTGPGPVNDRRGDSQSLSPEITIMAVCLTSTLTSPPPLLLFFFFPPLPFPPAIAVGKLDPVAVLCFHLVVRVTPKHGAAVNEIPVCHQSQADKDWIVVVV